MDNLAHSAFAVTLTAAIFPKLTAHYRWRCILAAIGIANMPDIDFILSIFGQKIYHFHHRGLTHSVFGLLLTIPICLFLSKWILKTKTLSQINIFFVLLHLLVSHFFLDFLTTYGVMFLYPYSFDRYSFPLMFIIDPIFWLITIFGSFILFINRLKNITKIRNTGIISLIAVLCLWGIELSSKFSIEKNYRQQFHEYSEIYTYPGPLAPLFWMIVGKTQLGDQTHLHQASYSTLRPTDKKLVSHPLPENFTHDQICPSMEKTAHKVEEFLRYQQFAELTACTEAVIQTQKGCICHGLKYTIIANPFLGFGGFWIPEQGEEDFMIQSMDMSWQTFKTFLLNGNSL